MLFRHPAVPYVAPFALFVAFLALGDPFRLGEWEFPFRAGVLAAALWIFSRGVIDLRVRRWAASAGLGVAVFVVWVAPDLLWPEYRQHWVFSNALTGQPSTALPDGFELSPLVLVFRTIRATVLVPIVEELFWRGWVMRWLIRPDFQNVALGSYSTASFLITAALFAAEHGPYWEVGLLAGLAYNAWIVRTKSLGDCIFAHAVTNGVLSAYVILAGKWEYWM